MRTWHTGYIHCLKSVIATIHKDYQQHQSQLIPPGILIYDQQYVYSARTALTLPLIMFVYCTCMYTQLCSFINNT